MVPSQLVSPPRVLFQNAIASRYRCAGFTLIELLVTIGILAIIAGSVVVAFNDAGQTAGDDLTRQRMAAVREGLLRFRGDMGYFPGEGPFQATDVSNLSAAPRIYPSNIDDRLYLDGQNPNSAAVSNDVLKTWADHRMNLWQLFQRPAIASDPLDPNLPHKWKWDPDVKRGWNGPYLGTGFHFRLDDAGLANDFAGGARRNRLMAVSDAFERNLQDENYLRWNNEAGAPPAKDYVGKFGRPLIFERYPEIGVPATFTLVSMGPDGLYDGPNPADWKDDLRLEVGREGN